MPNIEQMIDDLMNREGGYVNDKDDPGGATKYGITIHTLRAARGRKCTIQDIKALTKAEAKTIYIWHYYQKPRIDELPEALQASVFDMYVNSGRRAIRILQDLLSEFDEPVRVDGILGRQSLGAAERAFQKSGLYLVDAYGVERRNYYFRLADNRPASRKYARTRAGGKGGWIKRAEEFMRPQYRMTQAQFNERVSKWA